MKDLAVMLLLVVIAMLLVATIALVVELGKERSAQHVIERVIEVVEVPQEFAFYTGTELNEEVQKIVEGGGMQDVLDFFTYYTNNVHVSSAILQESLNQKVPITAAFALAWGESRFRPSVVNKNGGNTSDWGLFQLNDGHRPNWTRDDFFDIVKNTEEGLNYFSYSLEVFDNRLAAAIAGYNKGVENVKGGSSIPNMTLFHINNIIEYDRMLEIGLNRFLQRWHNER